MADPKPKPPPPAPVPVAKPVGPTQTMFDAATGAEVQVPVAQVRQALASGTAGFADTQEVVIDGPGGLERVSGRDAADRVGIAGHGVGSEAALAAQEQRIAERQEYGEGIGRGAEAAAAGALRGLTFGASDWAARKIGIGDELAKLKDYNPGLSIAGELGGAALPALFSGGTSAGASGAGLAARGAAEAATLGREAGVLSRGLGAIGRGTEAVGAFGEAAGRFLPEALGASEASATARILGGLGRGAAEGALDGVGQAISDASLKADPITIDKILAGGGMGALMGGGLGGGLAGLGVVVGGGVKAAGKAADWAMREEGAISKLLGREVKPMLDEFATGKALSALGPTQRMVEDLRALGPEIERRVASRVLDEVPELAGKRSLAQMRRPEIATAVEREQRWIGRQLETEYNLLDEAVAKTGIGTPQVGDVVTNTWRDVVQPLSLRPGYEDAAKHIGAALRTFEAGAAESGWSFRRLHHLTADLEAKAQRLGRTNPAASEAYEAAAKAMRTELSRAGDEAAAAAGLASFSAKSQALSDRLADYTWMANAVKRGTAADVKNRTFGLSEALGAIRGQSVGSQVGGAIGSIAGPFGQGAGALVGGALGSFGNAVMQHVIRTYGDQAAAVLAKRAVQSDALRAVTQTVDEMVDRRVRQALGRGAAASYAAARKGAVIAGTSDKPKQQRRDGGKGSLDERYARAQKATTQFVAANGGASKAATDRIRGVHPDLAWQLDAKAQKVGQNIQKRMPKQPMAGQVLPIGNAKKAPPPSDEAKASFLRYYTAATEPMKALDHLADGKLAKEHVDALKENYPELLAEARQRALEQIADGAGKKMPYERRFQLGLFLEAPTDLMLLPEMMAATKGVYDDLEAAAGQQQAGMAPGGPATSKTSFALQGASEGEMTRAERVERGSDALQRRWRHRRAEQRDEGAEEGVLAIRKGRLHGHRDVRRQLRPVHTVAAQGRAGAAH